MERSLPVWLDDAADIVEDRYFLLVAWCHVQSVCQALFRLFIYIYILIKSASGIVGKTSLTIVAVESTVYLQHIGVGVWEGGQAPAANVRLCLDVEVVVAHLDLGELNPHSVKARGSIL
jgi:hypothetical protein